MPSKNLAPICAALLLISSGEIRAQMFDCLLPLQGRESIEWVYLINYSKVASRERTIDIQNGRLLGHEKPVAPNVLVLGPLQRAPKSASDLYCAIRQLPDYADGIRIQYWVSTDRKTARFDSYVVESPAGIEIATIRYDGPLIYRHDVAVPWIRWIKDALRTRVPASITRK